MSDPKHPQNHRLLTVPEVADRLQVSVRTVRRLIASEKIKALRIGRAVRIKPTSLDDL